METTLVGIRYLFTLSFGIVLSASFAGLRINRRNAIAIVAFFAAEVALQAIINTIHDISVVRMAYPLLTHVPLVLVLALCCKGSWPVSIGAVLTAYLCCELPNTVEKLVLTGTTGDIAVSTAVYMISCVVFVAFLMRFVARPINQLLSYSTKSCVAFSAVPFIYYIWCYAAGVYTDWTQANAYEAMVAVSGMFAALFVIFAAVYSTEVRNKAKLEDARKKTEIQLTQASKELETLSRMQALTAEYRHDTRHRLRMLAALANAGDLDGIKGLIQEADRDLDAVTPKKYCANDTLNMVLSYFADECVRSDTRLKIAVRAPGRLPLSSTEICALVGNALDNAVAECAATPNASIDVQIIEHRNRLLVSIANTCTREIRFKNDMPVSEREGHGYGCASIKTIAEKHHGQALFAFNSGIFTLKVVIPLD